MTILLLKKIFIFCLVLFFSTSSKAKVIFTCIDSTPRLTAYVFLSETCPMCQSYVSVLKNLNEDFKNRGVKIVGVFPNFYIADSVIQQFAIEYKLNFALQRDTDFCLTDQLNAHVTPEVFLVDAAQKIVYSGAIDNAYFRAGKRRGKTSAFYLRDAIASVLNNTNVDVKHTEAFGCIILKN